MPFSRWNLRTVQRIPWRTIQRDGNHAVADHVDSNGHRLGLCPSLIEACGYVWSCQDFMRRARKARCVLVVRFRDDSPQLVRPELRAKYNLPRTDRKAWKAPLRMRFFDKPGPPPICLSDYLKRTHPVDRRRDRWRA